MLVGSMDVLKIPGYAQDPWIHPIPTDVPKSHRSPQDLQTVPSSRDVPWTHGYPHSRQIPLEEAPPGPPPEAGKPRGPAGPALARRGRWPDPAPGEEEEEEEAGEGAGPPR